MILLTSIPEFGKGKGELKFLYHCSRSYFERKNFNRIFEYYLIYFFKEILYEKLCKDKCNHHACLDRPSLVVGGGFLYLKFSLESFRGRVILIFFHNNLKSQHFMGKPLP